MRIAFLTCDKFRDLYEDDVLAATELRARGHVVSPVVWTEPSAVTPTEDDVLAATELRARGHVVSPVVWTEPHRLDDFELVVMRSPWDWFHRRAEFRAFLESLRRCRARVVNSAEVMLAFADKLYLPRLAAAGVDVVPTVALQPAELDQVPALLTARGWARAVLKPAFTANAVGARVFDARDAAGVVSGLRGEPDEVWLLQPFVPSIATGELSFVFFGGVFSHGVKKRPPAGEWRVQHEYGGVSEPFVPTAGQVSEATRLLALAAPGTVYARVDAVELDGRLHLMELEVVEPELFFRHHADAPRRFADALESAGEIAR